MNQSEEVARINCHILLPRISLSQAARVALVTMLVVSGCLTSCEKPQFWGRSIQVDSMPSGRSPLTLSLYDIRARGTDLEGRLSYDNVPPKSGLSNAVILMGKWDSHRKFWPRVRLEVGREEGEWRVISTTAKLFSMTKMTIGPDMRVDDLMVNLRPFKPYLKKYTVGRITVSSGDSTDFPLDDLLPPK